MTDVAHLTATTEYALVQQFYAHHMSLLDEGEAELWADTFTVGAVFSEPAKGEPIRGRDAIRESARRRADKVRGERVQFRHWVGMLHVTAQPDETVHTRFYTLVIATGSGEKPKTVASVDCRDVLDRTPGGGYLVRHRLLSVDGA